MKAWAFSTITKWAKKKTISKRNEYFFLPDDP